MKTSLLLSLTGLALSAACVTPIRASNRSFAPKDPSAIRFSGNPDEAVNWLSSTFEAGGFPAQIQYGESPNTVYVFQGNRGHVEGQVYWGRKGRSPLVGSIVPIGSIFYAYVQPTPDGSATYITLYGKPTVDGHQVCAADDSFWKLPCVEVEAAKDWTGRAAMSGATEASAVRKILAALPAAGAEKSAAAENFQPPATLPKPGQSSVDCQWTYQTGSHFQQLYCPNGEKTIIEQENERTLSSDLHTDPPARADPAMAAGGHR